MTDATHTPVPDCLLDDLLEAHSDLEGLIQVLLLLGADVTAGCGRDVAHAYYASLNCMSRRITDATNLGETLRGAVVS